MDKVDYNQFLYKPKKRSENKVEIKNFKEKKATPTKPKKNIGFILLVCLLVAIIIALSANFIFDNVVFDFIKKLFKTEETSYYLVCQSKSSNQLAYRTAADVKISGGSGYVFKDGEDYYVVFSAYLSKSDAETVAKKNSSTLIKAFSFKKTDDEILQFCFETLDRLIQKTIDYENGVITESGLLSFKNTQLKTILSIKENYSGKQKANILLLDFFEENLNNIQLVNNQKSVILSDLRHITSSLIYNLNSFE